MKGGRGCGKEEWDGSEGQKNVDLRDGRIRPCLWKVSREQRALEGREGPSPQVLVHVATRRVQRMLFSMCPYKVVPRARRTVSIGKHSRLLEVGITAATNGGGAFARFWKSSVRLSYEMNTKKAEFLRESFRGDHQIFNGPRIDHRMRASIQDEG